MKFRLGCIVTCMYLFQGALSTLLYWEIRIQNSLKSAFLIEQRQLQFLCRFVLPGENENFQIKSKPFTLGQVLKHGNEQPIDHESSCPCYYSQIEGLGLPGPCSSRARWPLAPNFCSWATRKSQIFHTNHMLGTLDFTGSEHWVPFNFL